MQKWGYSSPCHSNDLWTLCLKTIGAKHIRLSLIYKRVWIPCLCIASILPASPSHADESLQRVHSIAGITWGKAIGCHGTLTINNDPLFIDFSSWATWFIPPLHGNTVLHSTSILGRISCIFHMQQALVQNSALTAKSQDTAASLHCRENHPSVFQTQTSLACIHYPFPLIFYLIQTSSPYPQDTHFLL